MIQPGPYFTLDAPLVRILGLYSNVLENPGVIATSTDPSGKVSFENLGTAQLTYLEAALTRIKKEKFAGCGNLRGASSAVQLRASTRGRW